MKNQENIELVVNGESLTRTVDHRRNLVDFIRYDLELTLSLIQSPSPRDPKTSRMPSSA